MVSRFNGSSRRGSPWTRSSVLPAVNMLPIRADHTHRPSRRRLQRIADQWLPIGYANVIARITILDHGGHQRPVIHRGSKHQRFRIPSTKTNTTQVGEGRGEEALAYYNEVCTDVIDYQCHPYEITIMKGDRKQRYRPDSVRIFTDGHIELIEVKRTPQDLSDPEYRETLALISEVCRRCGWEFRVLFLHDILGTRERQMNVSALFCRRSMALSRTEERITGRLVGQARPIEWGALRDRFAPEDRLHGDAVIEHLLARGMLATDLDLAFTPRTVLMPTRPFTGISDIRL